MLYAMQSSHSLFKKNFFSLASAVVEGGSEIKPTEVKVPSFAIYFRDKKDINSVIVTFKKRRQVSHNILLQVVFI